MASVTPHMSQNRFVWRRAIAAAVAAGVVAAIVLVLSHGSAGGHATKQASPDDVAATVQRFGSALQNRDFNTVCSLFSASARAAEGGSGCASTLASNSVLLANPRVDVRSVTVHGQSATATITVKETNQPAMTEILELIREGGHMRIAAVVTPGD